MRMNKRYILFALLMIVSAVPSSWAGRKPSAEGTIINKVKEQPRRRVLFIGDSVTDGGWGRSGGLMTPSEKRNQYDQNHLFGHGYMEMCAAHFMSIYPERDYEFMNRGISGNTLYDLQRRWQQDALNLQPDVVSILVGINDADRFVRDTAQTEPNYIQWEQTYRQLIAEMRAVNPQVTILLGTPFVAKVGRVGSNENYPELASIVSRLAQIVRKIADEEHAVLVEYDLLFAHLQETAPRNDYWIWDGIHPTTAGHRRMADLWIEKAGGMLHYSTKNTINIL